MTPPREPRTAAGREHLAHHNRMEHWHPIDGRRDEALAAIEAIEAEAAGALREELTVDRIERAMLALPWREYATERDLAINIVRRLDAATPASAPLDEIAERLRAVTHFEAFGDAPNGDYVMFDKDDALTLLRAARLTAHAAATEETDA